MAELVVTDRGGRQHRLPAKPRFTVMEIIRDGGLNELLALCGGSCSCATCHVFVDAAFIDRVGAPGQFESELLDSSKHRRETSRLGCQIEMTAALDGLRVVIAPEED